MNRSVKLLVALLTISTLILLTALMVQTEGDITNARNAKADGFVINYSPRNVTRTSSFTTSAVDVSNCTSGYQVQFAVRQGSPVNTATLKLRNSLTGYDWVDYETLLSESGVSTTGIVIPSVAPGYYQQLVATLSNTNPVTVVLDSYCP